MDRHDKRSGTPVCSQPPSTGIASQAGGWGGVGKIDRGGAVQTCEHTSVQTCEHERKPKGRKSGCPPWYPEEA